MISAKILLVDDAEQVRRVLRTALAAAGYTIFEAPNGEEASNLLRSKPPDIVLLDVNMPGMDGLETCREIRRNSDVPILMLTVRNSERDKVMALDAGADDYVVKPFGMQELLARIRAALRRRSPPGRLTSYKSKELTIDFESRQVTVRGKDVHLTPKEFELLRQLVASEGKPLTHRRLLQAVWGFILTEPWVGYRFRGSAEHLAKEAADKEE
jgi:two-component system KDP operon response regulator KdpE